MVVFSSLGIVATAICSPFVRLALRDKTSNLNQWCRIFLFPATAAFTTILALILWRTKVLGNNFALAMAIIFPMLAFVWVLLNWLFGDEFNVACIDNGQEGEKEDI